MSEMFFVDSAVISPVGRAVDCKDLVMWEEEQVSVSWHKRFDKFLAVDESLDLSDIC